jgi:hypothetical protein
LKTTGVANHPMPDETPLHVGAGSRHRALNVATFDAVNPASLVLLP